MEVSMVGRLKKPSDVECFLALDVLDELVPRHALHIDVDADRLQQLLDGDADPLARRTPARHVDGGLEAVRIPGLRQ
jgi:hypothetical protein